MDELDATLERLIERQLVARLERRPGQRELRYEQLLGAEDVAHGAAPAPPEDAARIPPEGAARTPPEGAARIPPEGAARTPPEALEQRFERLEQEVAELREELRILQKRFSG